MVIENEQFNFHISFFPRPEKKQRQKPKLFIHFEDDTQMLHILQHFHYTSIPLIHINSNASSYFPTTIFFGGFHMKTSIACIKCIHCSNISFNNMNSFFSMCCFCSGKFPYADASITLHVCYAVDTPKKCS